MYQQLTLIGNLGNDPEMRYTPGGQAVTNFSLAVNRTYTYDGEKKQETAWFRVSVWGKQAEACNNYLKKGRKVMVVGRLNIDPATGGPRTYEKKDGTTGVNFEVTAFQTLFLSDSGERKTTNHTVESEDDLVPNLFTDDDPVF